MIIRKVFNDEWMWEKSDATYFYVSPFITTKYGTLTHNHNHLNNYPHYFPGDKKVCPYCGESVPIFIQLYIGKKVYG